MSPIELTAIVEFHGKARSMARPACRFRRSAAGRKRAGDVFNWKKKYDGVLTSQMRQLKQLADEYAKLNKLASDLGLHKGDT